MGAALGGAEDDGVAVGECSGAQGTENGLLLFSHFFAFDANDLLDSEIS